MKLNVKTIGSKVLAAAAAIAVVSANTAQAVTATAARPVAEAAVETFTSSAMSSLVNAQGSTFRAAVESLQISNLVGKASLSSAEAALLTSRLSGSSNAARTLSAALAAINQETRNMTSAKHGDYLNALAAMPLDQVVAKAGSVAQSIKAQAVQTNSASAGEINQTNNLGMVRDIAKGRFAAVGVGAAKVAAAEAGITYAINNPKVAGVVGVDAPKCLREFQQLAGHNKLATGFGAITGATSEVDASERVESALLTKEYAGVPTAEACRAIRGGLMQTDAEVVSQARNGGTSCQVFRAYPNMKSACATAGAR